MRIGEASFDEIRRYLEATGCADNYLDLLLVKKKISDYKFFSLKRKGEVIAIAGLSPDNSLSIYSLESINSVKMLENLSFLYDKIHIILGPLALDQKIRANFIVKKFNAFNYMVLGQISLSDECSVKVRKATPLDQELVNQWYEAFNFHEKANWDIPNLKASPVPCLYLSFISSDFVGGCANTLESSKRAWVGRLFAFPRYRGLKVGSALMNQIEHGALEENKQVALLVNATNEIAINFYLKRGYVLKDENAYWCF